MFFFLSNFLAVSTNLFASSGFAGIALNGCSSSGGDLRSAVAPSNAWRFLTHNKSEGFKGGLPVNFVGVEGKVLSPARGHKVVVKVMGPQSVGCCQGPTLDCSQSEVQDNPQLSVFFLLPLPILDLAIPILQFIVLDWQLVRRQDRQLA